MASSRSSLLGAKSRCKACNHPGAQALNAMLLNGAKYKDIIAKMKAAHPAEVELNDANLSRHWRDHVQTEPIAVETTDPDTGLVTRGYLAGHLMQTLDVPKEMIPRDAVPIADALKTIIAAGVRNILLDPKMVGPKELVAALDMARKLNLFGDEAEAFSEAWKAFGASKSAGKRKRTRKVTVEETQELEDDDDGKRADEEIIDILPAEWAEMSGDEPKLLGSLEDERPTD